MVIRKETVQKLDELGNGLIRVVIDLVDGVEVPWGEIREEMADALRSLNADLGQVHESHAVMAAEIARLNEKNRKFLEALKAADSVMHRLHGCSHRPCNACSENEKAVLLVRSIIAADHTEKVGF